MEKEDEVSQYFGVLECLPFYSIAFILVILEFKVEVI